MYTQVIFAFDRIMELSGEHPEWKNTEPFKSIITHNKNAIAKFSLKDLEKIMLATHTNMTVESFQLIVKKWLAQAKHPRWNRPNRALIT